MYTDEEKKKQYVWYVGYGSNLCKERFLCYIQGGRFKWGGCEARGCKDKTLPKESKPFWIPYRLYFSGKSRCWENKGVAFIYTCEEPDNNNWTVGRMWKITREQYEEVRYQEGSWYDNEILLGKEDGIPIYTFTSRSKRFICEPSEGYLKTIALGLRETISWTAEEIFQYLEKKDGIKSKIDENKLLEIIKTAISFA
ncbi:MAG: hypothetical protein RMI79_06270 [Nitrososphaerota archaeon]|nr:hypothetical protein [Nitrososphaerota archaeon]